MPSTISLIKELMVFKKKKEEELMVYPNEAVLCSHNKRGKSILPYIKQSSTNEINFH